MQISTPFDLLKGTAYEQYTFSATKLTSGMVNHVWRVSDKDGRTVIVKYASSRMSAFPDNEFSTERMGFEVRGLALLNGKRQLATVITYIPGLCELNDFGQDLTDTPGVHIPQLLYYDSSVPFIVLEDVGNLKAYDAWYAPNQPHPPMDDLLLVSRRTGEWLARLHEFGFKNYAKLEKYFVNWPVQTLMDNVYYTGLYKRIAKHPEFANDSDAFIKLIMDFHQEVKQPENAKGKTLVFGDLWTTSILFNPGSRAVNLIDLECFDIDHIYSDIGHLAAHLLPAYYVCNPDYNPSTDPCPEPVVAFLNAYKETLKGECPEAYKVLVSSDAVRQSTIFFGIELAFDVSIGSWCRCDKGRDVKDEPAMSCACVKDLFHIAKEYIKNTPESIFNSLNSPE
ncbi:hypothetical protein LPJ66_004132 [Kickxella alabastrina]|uniref:Uncharacterized protein n=1 Tax=Kickxella alabastrina TaxID=61397 RepID=A0ACC1IM01_9FUNG|nr:hypothetical protein LPJ66_004132 [Kickxella alabastrina]